MLGVGILSVLSIFTHHQSYHHMKLLLHPPFRKILLACITTLTSLSLTLPTHAADGDNFDTLELRDQDFRGESFVGSSWENAQVYDSTFEGVDLSDSSFVDATISRTDFSNANLSNADLSNAILAWSIFTNAKLDNANISGAVIHGVGHDADRGMTLSHETLKSTFNYKVSKSFQFVDFVNSDLSSFDFSAFNLLGLDFRNVVLSGASFASANLQDALFENVDLSGADFTDSDISSASFVLGPYIAILPDGPQALSYDALKSTKNYKSKNLGFTHWDGYDMKGYDFSGFNLRNTSFKNVSLQDADLSGADMERSSLINCDLRGADLDGVLNFPSGGHYIDTDGRIHADNLLSGNIFFDVGHHDTISTYLAHDMTLQNGAQLYIDSGSSVTVKETGSLTINSSGQLVLGVDLDQQPSFTGIKLEGAAQLTVGTYENIEIILSSARPVDDFHVSFLQGEMIDPIAMEALLKEHLTVNFYTLDSIGYEIYWDEASSSFVLTGDYVPDDTVTPPMYSYVTKSQNSRAGEQLANSVVSSGQGGPDIQAALSALSQYVSVGDLDAAERLAAAVAGSAVTSLGSAAIGSVEGRLQALRNQSTRGLKKSEREVWISAEGNFSDLSADGTMAGYQLDTWGGSVGGAWGLSDQMQLTAAVTALYGDLDAQGPDVASGEMDGYYVALGASYKQQSWNHRFVATMGWLDASLDRSVAAGSHLYRTQGDTKGHALGLMYEIGYEIALDESQILEPIINLSFISTQLDAYTETGSDAALRVAKQQNTYMSVGVGTRYSQQISASLSCAAYALVRFDAGDRQVDADVSMAGSESVRIKGSDTGAVGVEFGLGTSYQLSEQSSLYANGNIEMRGGDYTNVNATVGYRISF